MRLLLAATVATLGACASEPLGPERSAEDECSELGKVQQPWQSLCFRKSETRASLVADCPMNARRRFRAVPDRTWSVVLACQDDLAY